MKIRAIIGDLRRGNGDRVGTRVRDAGVIYAPPRPEYVFHGLLCGIDYQCPLYLVDWGPQNFLDERARYFLFIARLIARSTSLLTYAPGSRSFALLIPVPLLSLFSPFFSPLRWRQVQIVCIVRIFPMILAIILNCARNRESKDSRTRELQHRQLGERYTSVRLVLNFFSFYSSYSPKHSLPLFLLVPDKSHTHPAKSTGW